MQKLRITLTLLLVCMFTFGVYAQKVSLSGTITNYANKTIKLQRYFLDKAITQDSLQSTGTGDFSFDMNQMNPGQYRLIFANKSSIDFIFEQKNIQLKADLKNIRNSLTFIESQENTIFHTYLKKRDESYLKLEMLTQMLEYFPKEDTFYLQIKNKFEGEQRSLKQYIQQTSSTYRGSFLSKYLLSDQKPLLEANMNMEVQKVFLRQHSLDYVDFDDTTLLYSNLFAGKVMDYLGLFQNNQLTKPQLEREYIKAVDHILSQAMFNEVVFQHIMEFLVNGFEHFYFTEVVTYIAENFELSESCQNLERKNELQEKLQAYQRLAIGKTAPDILMNDLKGKSFQLSRIKAENTLILFWASWCPHCKEIFPELIDLYNSIDKEDLEIIAISLDKNPKELQGYLDEHDCSFINACDYKGWDTQAALDYHIYSTPTLLLLDEEKTIIGRPESVQEIIQKL